MSYAASIGIGSPSSPGAEGKPREAFVCGVCRKPLPPRARRRGSARKWCSQECGRVAWERAHPERRQKLLDFAPPPAPLPPVQDQRVPRREVRRLSEASMRIEVVLRLEGPVSNRGLALMFPPGSAWRTRVSDLRLWLQKQGETVASYDCGGGLWWYWLEER